MNEWLCPTSKFQVWEGSLAPARGDGELWKARTGERESGGAGRGCSQSRLTGGGGPARTSRPGVVPARLGAGLRQPAWRRAPSPASSTLQPTGRERERPGEAGQLAGGESQAWAPGSGEPQPAPPGLGAWGWGWGRGRDPRPWASAAKGILLGAAARAAGGRGRGVPGGPRGLDRAIRAEGGCGTPRSRGAGRGLRGAGPARGGRGRPAPG